MKTIQVQVTITFDETAAKEVAECLLPALKQAMGLPSSESNQERNAHVRGFEHVSVSGGKPLETHGLLVDTKEAAKLLKVSPRTLWSMYTSGEMPQPIRIGTSVRWSFEALKKWVEAGCPPCRDSAAGAKNARK